jgi:hypothetical protein
VVFQSAQNRVAAERVSFKLASLLDVRQEVLFTLREFRRDTGSTAAFFFANFRVHSRGGLALRFP